MKVESKYKNPDRFIRRLQRRIKDVRQLASRNWDMFDRERKKRGEVICTWTSGEDVQSGSSNVLAQLNPCDKIAIIGEVVEVRSRGGKAAITYVIKETRRIKKGPK